MSGFRKRESLLLSFLLWDYNSYNNSLKTANNRRDNREGTEEKTSTKVDFSKVKWGGYMRTSLTI